MTQHIAMRTHQLEQAVSHFLHRREQSNSSVDSEALRKLYQTMYHSVKFNQALSLEYPGENLALVADYPSMLKIFQLRSEIYRKLGYDQEFSEEIPGLNYDRHDVRSAILYTTFDHQVTGTCRVIFDSPKGLQMEAQYPLDSYRKAGHKLAELSRLVIKKRGSGLGQEPRLLTVGTYYALKNNGFTMLVSVMTREHSKLYRKFGGFEIVDQLEHYGSIEKDLVVTVWDITKISRFFKKVFLGRQ